MAEFFPYFFTHLSQFFNSQQGVENWIAPALPVGFFRPETQEQNNLYFNISKRQPVGELKVELKQGDAVLDVSTAIPIDGSHLRADLTTQPVSDFISTAQTPLTNPQLTREYTLDSIDYQFSKQYPTMQLVEIAEGIYPNQKVTQEVFVDNPILVEPIEFRQELTDGGEVLYDMLTVDKTTIKISDETVPEDIYEASLTADRAGYYKYAPEGMAVLDISSPDDTDRRVLLVGIPDGDITTSWRVGDQIISKIYFPSTPRGYLPAEIIGEVMQGAKLSSIALSLLTLIDKKNNLLLLSSLKELCYIWSSVLRNVTKEDVVQLEVLPGLPTYLPKLIPDIQYLDTSRSTLEQAWLGLAIVQAINYLQRTEDYKTFIPKWLPEMLHQLALTVAKTVDATTGDTYVGFDEYGYLIDQVDIPSTVMTQLFLHSYLSIHYDLTVHQAAARTYTKLLSTQRVEFDDGTQIHPAPLYKLFWNIVQSRHQDTQVLVPQIAQYVANSKLSDFCVGLWVWCLQIMPEQYDSIDYQDLEPFENLRDDLYERTPDPGLLKTYTPSLICSCWAFLLDEQPSETLNPDFDFYLAAEDARAFEQAMFLETKRMLPYGYQWFSEEAKEYGKIAAILLALSQLSFRWYLAYSVFWRGRNLLKAQGIALTYWASSLGIVREPLQLDSLLRQLCLPLISSKRSTLAAISEAGVRHLTQVRMVEPEPLALRLEGGDYKDWNTLTPSEIDSLSEEQLIKVERDEYPTSARIQSLHVDVTWENIAPSVVVYTKQVLPSFTDDIRGGLPASVALRMYALFSYKDKGRTFASSYLGRVSSG